MCFLQYSLTVSPYYAIKEPDFLSESHKIQFRFTLFLFYYTGGFYVKLQKLFSLTRQAVDDYQMIAEGDRIAIGISGGKDSLTLLYALQGLQKFYPHHFELEAVTVDLGYPGFDLEPIRELCQKLQVPYTVVPTQISKIVFEERHEHISHWGRGFVALPDNKSLQIYPGKFCKIQKTEPCDSEKPQNSVPNG